MMKETKFILLLALLLLSHKMMGQQWAASEIPDSLKAGANAVVRLSETQYHVDGLGGYTQEIKKVITVLNPKGDPYGALDIYYDGDSKVSNIAGAVYNAEGKRLRKLKSKEIVDFASNNSYTLLGDRRRKVYSPSLNSYPYTVAYSYKVRCTDLLAFDIWFAQPASKVAVQQASLEVNFPLDYAIKYKVLNADLQFEEAKDENHRQWKWKSKSVKPFKNRRYAPGFYHVYPMVLLSPEKIYYNHTHGDFSTWENYGKWVYKLISERENVSPEMTADVRKLTEGIADKREKVKVVYQYMQGRTRYINIALGIGGFQPMDALDVAQNGYGDCKALSNYTRVLLKQIGIPSFYTEIGNGENQKLEFPDFVNLNQTNHVILCVPMEKDSIWLECTSQNMPFGFIGSSNANRNALLITEKGGKVVRTPVYEESGNIRKGVVEVELKANGNATFVATQEVHNSLYSVFMPYLLSSSKEQRKAFLSNMPDKKFTLDQLSVEDQSKDHPLISISSNGSMDSYGKAVGSRLFVEPEYLFDVSRLYLFNKERSQAIYHSEGMVEHDELIIKYPLGYKLSAVPKDVEYSSVYGSYSLKYDVSEPGVLVLRRSVRHHAGSFGKEQISEINTYVAKVRRANRKKLVFRKKT